MDKLFSDLKNTAKTAAKKSGDLLEISKLKLAVMETRSRIDDAFQKLGKLVYDSAKNSDVEFDAESVISEIDELFNTLDEKQEQYAALKNEKKCNVCGEMNALKAVFCSNCGEKFE